MIEERTQPSLAQYLSNRQAYIQLLPKAAGQLLDTYRVKIAHIHTVIT
jgi:hypothetical protein